MVGEKESDSRGIEVNGKPLDVPIKTETCIEITDFFDWEDSNQDMIGREVKIYLSRWDHFKDRYFPNWLKRRFPIRSFDGVVSEFVNGIFKVKDGGGGEL